MSAKPAGGGRISLQNAAGDSVFTFEAPTLEDAAGAQSSAASFALAAVSGGYRVTLNVDSAWLRSLKRQWPVVVDPTTTVALSAGRDCYIDSTTPSMSYCSGSTDKVGYQAGARRALLYFNVGAAVPTGVEVLQADLKLYMRNDPYKGSLQLGVYPLTRDWTTSATWNSAGPASWTTAGGDFTSANSYITNLGVINANTWYHWYPTTLVQGWADGSIANYGMIVKEPAPETTLGLPDFESARTTSGHPPELDVTYQYGTGSRPAQSFESQSLSDRMDESVNRTTGNLLVHVNDLSITGTGLDLSVDRYYNSLTANSNPATALGQGWRLSVGQDQHLEVQSDGSVVYVGENGYTVSYVKQADGSFLTPAGEDATLVQNANQTYTLTFHASGEKLAFTSSGQMTDDTDANGNSIQYTYTSGLLTSITDTQGRTTTLNYTSGKLMSIVDSSGRTTTFTYNANGNLASTTDPANKTTTYSYDPTWPWVLIKITDPRNNWTSFDYDGNWRVLHVRRGNGSSTTTFQYNTPGPLQSKVQDPNGHWTTYDYNGENEVVKATDPLGNADTATWNDDRKQTTSTLDPADAPPSPPATTTYDASGEKPLTVTTPVEAAKGNTSTQITRLEYNDPANPYQATKVTDPQNRSITYGYDSKGNPTSVTDQLANQNSAAATYNANGTVATETNFKNKKTTLGYDAAGNPTSESFPADAGTTYRSSVTASNPAGYWRLGESSGSSLSDETANANTGSYQGGSSLGSQGALDGDANTAASFDGSSGYASIPNSSSLNPTAGVALEAWVNPTQSSNFDNQIPIIVKCSAQTYNPPYYQYALTMTDNGGSKRLTFYFTVGGSVTGVGADSTGWRYGAWNHIVASYDGQAMALYVNGAQVKTVPMTGTLSTYATPVDIGAYDCLNKDASSLFKGKIDEAAVYGHGLSGGEIMSHYRAGTYEHKNGYDALGRVTSQIDGKREASSQTYDALDRPLVTTYADGSSITYSYDANGNVLTMADNTGTTTYTYDALNRLTSETLPSGHVNLYGYDPVGNLISTTDAGGTTTYTYNSVNEVVTMTDPTQQQTTFTYWADGNRKDTVYPNGVTLTQSYDDSGRTTTIVGKRAASGTTVQSRTYSYSDPTTGKDTDLLQSVTDQVGYVTSYSYNDALNRLTQAQTKNAGGTVTDTRTYTYDGNSNRTTQTVNGTTTNYNYNASDELTTGGSTTYRYDGAGNQTGNSAGLALTYNAKGQTTSITPPGSSAINYTYTGPTQAVPTQIGATNLSNSALGLAQESGGSSITYTRDPNGYLIVEHGPSGSLYPIFDVNGSIIGLTNSSGQLIDTYGYDPYGQVIGHTGTTQQPYQFEGGYGARTDTQTGLVVIGGSVYSAATGTTTQAGGGTSAGGSRPGTPSGYMWVGQEELRGTLGPAGRSGAVPFIQGVMGRVMRYSQARAYTAGFGGEYQAHHLLEVRLLRQWGLESEIGSSPAVILTRAEHQAITNALRREMPYGFRYSPTHARVVYRRLYRALGHENWFRSIERYLH